MKTVILDAKRMEEKGPAHDYLQEVLDLPDYYGGNLDALYDCLTEMNDLQIQIINSEDAEGYYPRIYDVLEEAAEENEGISIELMEEEW